MRQVNFDNEYKRLASIHLQDLKLSHLAEAEALLAINASLVAENGLAQRYEYKTRQMFFGAGIGTMLISGGVEVKRDMRGRYFVNRKELKSSALTSLWERFVSYGDIDSEGQVSTQPDGKMQSKAVYQGKMKIQQLAIPAPVKYGQVLPDAIKSNSMVIPRLENLFGKARSGYSLDEQVELSLLVMAAVMIRECYIDKTRGFIYEAFTRISMKLLSPFAIDNKPGYFEAGMTSLQYTWYLMSLGREKRVLASRGNHQIALNVKHSAAVIKLNLLDDVEAEVKTDVLSETELKVIYRMHTTSSVTLK